jgi:intein/homing endonuclease
MALTAERVTRVFVHPGDRAFVVVNGTLWATPNHPFFANGRWVRADRLRPGDRMISMASDAKVGVLAVQSLETIQRPGPTYNLEVSNAHTYFAGGFLVHNK